MPQAKVQIECDMSKEQSYLKGWLTEEAKKPEVETVLGPESQTRGDNDSERKSRSLLERVAWMKQDSSVKVRRRLPSRTIIQGRMK